MPALEIVLLFTAFCLAFQMVWTMRQRHSICGTNLTSAWVWAILAEFACCLSCLLTLIHVESAVVDQCWYFTAILMLCPFISVLGARSPTHRVWNWFIILPLVAVLGWPALTLWFEAGDLPRLILQTPVFVGLFLVLVMGIGNFLGTRFGGAAFWIGCSGVCLLAPYRYSSGEFAQHAINFRCIAAVLFSFGVYRVFAQAQRPALEESRFDRLWFDFRDTFGIVWSIRIQERVNQTAESEKWLCRLGPLGFEWQNLPEDVSPQEPQSALSRQETEHKLEHTLRWLLRRFVTPAWIDQRLAAEDVRSGQSRR